MARQRCLLGPPEPAAELAPSPSVKPFQHPLHVFGKGAFQLSLDAPDSTVHMRRNWDGGPFGGPSYMIRFLHKP